MFGLISAGISLAGLGMSAVQAIQEGKRMKDAKKTSKSIFQQARNRKEQNAYDAMQVQDTSGYSRDVNESQFQSAIGAVQGMGPETAIGGVANAYQAARGAELETSMKQAEMVNERNAMRAEAQQGINERQTERDLYLDALELNQANQEFNDASANKAAAIESMFGQGISALGFAKEDFDPATGRYKYKNSSNNYNSPQAPKGLGGYGASF